MSPNIYRLYSVSFSCFSSGAFSHYCSKYRDRIVGTGIRKSEQISVNFNEDRWYLWKSHMAEMRWGDNYKSHSQPSHLGELNRAPDTLALAFGEGPHLREGSGWGQRARRASKKKARGPEMSTGISIFSLIVMKGMGTSLLPSCPT